MIRLHLYRSADGYRWRRIRPGHPSAWSVAGFPRKTAMWRNCRRNNPDWQHCLVDDRTFSWRRGGLDTLARPADPKPPPAQDTRRPLPPIEEARKRL